MGWRRGWEKAPGSDPEKDRRTTAPDRLVKGLVWLVAVFVVLLVPVYLSGWMAALSGWPLVWVRVLACLGWALVLYALAWRLVWVPHARRRKAGYKDPRNMFSEVLEALDSIASGNYDVSVETDERFHYSELGDKVNNLARQLSSMEQMRQDFVSNVSHEIQSPLTSIAGFAELLRKEDLTGEERRHYIDVIQDEAKRMSGLSDSLLRLSMLDSGATPDEKTTFRLDRQIEGVLLAQEPQWAAKAIELDIAMPEVTCTGYEDLLLQVWQNLVQNAVKFTPQGGQITVRLERADGQVRCTVKDSGIGIPPEDMVHIFERFYKVDKARDRKMGGNGLGLPLAKRIVELHGGQMSVASTPGAGSTFTVALPAEPAEAPKAADSAPV